MSRISVIYLGGFGRSGSTLVERLLGAVPGWVNVGELVDLARSVAPADERCGCGVRFSQCPVWNEVGAAAFGGWTPSVLERLRDLHRAAARQRHLPRLLGRSGHDSDALLELRESYARLYRAIAEVTDSVVVVDASKGPALGQALVRAAGIDVRLLNVVRDPRAVAWSWTKQVRRPHATAPASPATGPQVTGSEMWRIPTHRSAAQWSALQIEMEAIARLGGGRSARLRYEDFLADPRASLVDACRQLGLPLSPTELPPVRQGRVELAPSHGLSGNPSRFVSGPVELRRDEGWRSGMALTDRVLVTAVTLPLLLAYGYHRDEAAKSPSPAELTRGDR